MTVALATRLRAYFDLLAQRSDLQVVEYVAQPGTPASQIDPRVPHDVRELAKDLRRMTFAWTLAGESPRSAQSGGRFGFVADGLHEFAPAEWGDAAEVPFTEALTIDEVVPEGNGLLVIAEHGAIVVFEDANDGSYKPFSSFEAYVTAGAKRAFSWYWPAGRTHGCEPVDRLLDNSLDRETPPPILVEALVRRSLSRGLAESLVDWLGGDVVVLLEIER